MTDLADYPSNFWIEPEQVQHIICGTPRAVEQARAAGVPTQRLHAASGMIIRPEFYARPALDRDAERRALGLAPHAMTGLVMFGGQGASVMERIARQLEDTPLILVCGHNQRLAARLRKIRFAAPHVVVGYTQRIQHYMRLCDFMIGKPGPGSISEAMQLQLPVIVVRNSWTMPQERYNTQWIRDNRVGLVLRSYRDLPRAMVEMRCRLGELRSQAARVHNRAVFELPGLLAQILAARTPSRRTALQPITRVPGYAAVHAPERATRSSGSPIRMREPGVRP
jgi:UDP-N-acetylglucosamine:LPS N-acetylglucosamine transferase